MRTGPKKAEEGGKARSGSQGAENQNPTRSGGRKKGRTGGQKNLTLSKTAKKGNQEGNDISEIQKGTSKMASEDRNIKKKAGPLVRKSLREDPRPMGGTIFLIFQQEKKNHERRGKHREKNRLGAVKDAL